MLQLPTVKRTTDHSISGLTISETVTRDFTFSVEQLKRACTAEKLIGHVLDREHVKELVISVIQENRHELFGIFVVYSWKITFNGLHQLKKIQCNEFTLTPDQLFVKLEEIYN